jgi:hypothetical protein
LRKRIFDVLGDNIELALVLKVVQTTHPCESASQALCPFEDIPYLLGVRLDVCLEKEN